MTHWRRVENIWCAWPAMPIGLIEIIGGRSMGFFAKNGKLIAVIMINIICKTEEIRILLFT